MNNIIIITIVVVVVEVMARGNAFNDTIDNRTQRRREISGEVARRGDREPPRRRRRRRRGGGGVGGGGGGGYRLVSVRARSAAAVCVCARRPSPRSGAPDVTSAPGIGRRRDRGAHRPASGGPDVRRVSSSRVYTSRATITCLTIEFITPSAINARPRVLFFSYENII